MQTNNERDGLWVSSILTNYELDLLMAYEQNDLLEKLTKGEYDGFFENCTLISEEKVVQKS